MKPMLKYVGGKQKEIPCFLEHIPEKFDTYIEPFLGGGAVFFHESCRWIPLNLFRGGKRLIPPFY